MLGSDLQFQDPSEFIINHREQKENNYLFKKYSPDLVIVTALCGFEYNELFAREANKHGVPVCSVVSSWDNTSGMGMPGYISDYVIRSH